jgi:hypothetical protein
MNYLTRAEIDRNLMKLRGRGCDAHPSVLIHPRSPNNEAISNLSKDELIAGGPRHVIAHNREQFIVRHQGYGSGRNYVAQGWKTGFSHEFATIHELKNFLSGKTPRAA